MQSMYTLSGGQKSRVAFAKVPPPLLRLTVQEFIMPVANGEGTR